MSTEQIKSMMDLAKEQEQADTEIKKERALAIREFSKSLMRDFFAGLAMNGMLSNSGRDFDKTHEEVAEKAYQQANAMVENESLADDFLGDLLDLYL